MELSAAFWEYAENYFRQSAVIMRLSYWEIKLSRDPAIDEDGEAIWADIEVGKQRFRATVRLGQKFHDGTPDEKRQTIAHELTHCWTTPIFWAMERAFKDDVPLAQWDSKSASVDYQHEIATDEIGSIIAPLLPVWTYEEPEEEDEEEEQEAA